jgi:hypothetical protein
VGRALEAVHGRGLIAYIRLDLEGNRKARYAHRLLKLRRRVEFSIGYDVPYAKLPSRSVLVLRSTAGRR